VITVPTEIANLLGYSLSIIEASRAWLRLVLGARTRVDLCAFPRGGPHQHP
jgi:hypothetical protein